MRLLGLTLAAGVGADHAQLSYDYYSSDRVRHHLSGPATSSPGVWSRALSYAERATRHGVGLVLAAHVERRSELFADLLEAGNP
jgi:2-iminoacetate synthase ThiH